MLKNISKEKRILLWVIIGFFFIMFDQNISLGKINPYPQYKTDIAHNLEFQVYSLNYSYGADCEMDEYYTGDVYYKLTFDIIPDVVGFIILGIFLKKLSKYSRIFGVASVTSWVAVALYSIIHLMPFVFNGMVLSYMCFWLSIAMFGVEVVAGYVFISGVCDALSGYEHRSSRKAIVISWFGSMVLAAVVCVLRWIAVINPALLVTYEMLQLAISLLFFYFVIKESDFIVKEKSLDK